MSSESDLQGLAGLSALYRETPDERPPAQLDKRLLAAARREARRGRRRGMRRVAPLALAATLVLGVALVSLLRREAPPVSDALVRGVKPLAPAEQSMPLPESDKSGRRDMPALPANRLSPQAPIGQRSLDQHKMQATEARRAAPAREPAPAAESPASIAQEAAPLPPEQWLHEIAELRRQGREAEAEAELRAFRARYPDYPAGALEKSDE